MEKAFAVAFEHIDKLSNTEIEDRTVYEFGVYKGDSLDFIMRYFSKKKVYPNCVYGFDSFEGLPEEKNDKHNYNAWIKGAFNASKDLSLTPDAAAIGIQQKLKNKFKYDNLSLIKTWFCNIKYDERMKVASLINIDCDTYTSTCEALTFLLTHNLIDEKSIIRFDDWGGTPEFLGGESKALSDVCEKFGFKYTIVHKIHYGGPHAKAVVMLNKI